MRSEVSQELERLKNESGGVLLPQKVVEVARKKTNPLHSWFEWNNGEAAEKYRLHQARQLIRLYVAPADTEHGAVKLRGMVSLSVDRKAGGGYRTIAEVVSNEELYRNLLTDALAELQVVERKYQRLSELRPVFKEAQKVRDQFEHGKDASNQEAAQAG